LYITPTTRPPQMATSRLHTIDAELLRCHHQAQKTLVGKVLSVLQDIETRAPPCSRCYGPKAECRCPPRCRACDSERACVCEGECWGKCSACTGCSKRSLENAKSVAGLVDSVLAVRNVSPAAHPAMVEIIDSLLKTVDGGTALRVERVRIMLARKMLRRIMAKVAALLVRINGLDLTSDAAWGNAFVVIHDIRDVFVHSRVPATVIHPEFGRMVNAVCGALAVPEPEEWLSLSACARPKALCDLLRAALRAAGSVDAASFLGSWGRAQVVRVVGVIHK